MLITPADLLLGLVRLKPISLQFIQGPECRIFG